VTVLTSLIASHLISSHLTLASVSRLYARDRADAAAGGVRGGAERGGGGAGQARWGLYTLLTPPDPQLKGAWYPGGFNPCTYQVRNPVSKCAFSKCNLHRYSAGPTRARRTPRWGCTGWIQLTHSARNRLVSTLEPMKGKNWFQSLLSNSTCPATPREATSRPWRPSSCRCCSPSGKGTGCSFETTTTKDLSLSELKFFLLRFLSGRACMRSHVREHSDDELS
jgi:hypothetical protein